MVCKHLATKRNFSDGSNHKRARTSDEVDEQRAMQTIRAYQVDRPPGADRAAQVRKREVNPSYPSMDLPNGLSS
jgi:hypothetical protein